MRQISESGTIVGQPSLEDRLNAISELFNEGDYVGALRLIEQDLLESWYGFRPEQLHVMLSTIVAAGHDDSAIARGLLAFLNALGGLEAGNGSALAALDNPAQVNPVFSQLAKVVAFRVDGQATEALRQLDRLDARSHAVQTFFDTRNGWELMISVQSGITAMLAGEFTRALTYFVSAHFHPARYSLVFLTRDAYVKSALIHATFGDTDLARLALAQAANLPRSVSWTEVLIDATTLMVEALLETDASRAITSFLTIPVRDVGELWPFYVVTMHRLFDRADRLNDLASHLTALERLPFPRKVGEGFTGSVLRLTRAALNTRRQDLDTARWLINETDSSYVGGRLLAAYVDVHDGRPQRAIDAAWSLGDATKGLRQYELWRYSILAFGYFKLGRPEESRDCLTAAFNLSGEIRTEDLEFFPLELQQLASKHIEGWPKLSPLTAKTIPLVISEQTLNLTSREREILRMLAHGTSRAEMAQALFVTLNTLKTHLKAIYKKLGVSTRDAAVLRAQSEGWL